MIINNQAASDLDSGISSGVNKYAGDATAGTLIRTDQDVQVLHGELDRWCD